MKDHAKGTSNVQHVKLQLSLHTCTSLGRKHYSVRYN